LAPLGGFLGSHDVGIASNGWAGLCADLDPGGYALECPLPPYPHSGSRGQELIQQTLWVAPGWTTLVFLPCLPGRRLPSLELASVHMAEIDAGFEPYEAEARQVNLAAELALNGMRTSQRLVPDDLLNLLLHAKFKNPMLGILGAHVLLQGPKTKWQLFDQVVENLKKMLGEAPDCTALEVLGQGRRRSETVSFSAVSWPPMLAAGYRALIAHDSDSPGLIEDGSVADHAAAVLHTSWPWSRWTRLEPEVLQELDDSGGFEMAVGEEPWNPPWGEALRTRTSTTRGAGVLGGVRSMDERAGESPTNEAARELLRQWLMERETEGKLIFPRKGEGPAVAQVTEYLQRMAEQSTYGDGRADLSRLTLSQLSRRVGLPVSTVRRAVSALVISGLSQK
ncbi:MAG: helix-turn-helix domain-containing protein, partial [Acidobacteria bacterium]|nr:helix-turn-helix domain-containing protein [Acidobacteriota bacterium]